MLKGWTVPYVNVLANPENLSYRTLVVIFISIFITNCLVCIYFWVEIYWIETNKRTSRIIMNLTGCAWFRTTEVKYFYNENGIKNDVACCTIIALSLMNRPASNATSTESLLVHTLCCFQWKRKKWRTSEWWYTSALLTLHTDTWPFNCSYIVGLLLSTKSRR